MGLLHLTVRAFRHSKCSVFPGRLAGAAADSSNPAETVKEETHQLLPAALDNQKQAATTKPSPMLEELATLIMSL